MNAAQARKTIERLIRPDETVIIVQEFGNSPVEQAGKVNERADWAKFHVWVGKGDMTRGRWSSDVTLAQAVHKAEAALNPAPQPQALQVPPAPQAVPASEPAGTPS